jgi:5-(aminomethyl)-3-furanmethanol phosphate kinase
LPITTVVKVGGGLLAQAGRLDEVLATLDAAGGTSSLLVVPGGGPFADAVREVEHQIGLSNDAAHWMAIMAMDQYAQLISSRLTNGKLVTTSREIATALEDGRIPVLAPYQWIRSADPLPHSWDVTSDSIAAWIVGQVGATRLVLVKPSGASGPDIVDSCFDRVVPPHVTVEIVTADRFVAAGL